jgi:hypothetical protein
MQQLSDTQPVEENPFSTGGTVTGCVFFVDRAARSTTTLWPVE